MSSEANKIYFSRVCLRAIEKHKANSEKYASAQADNRTGALNEYFAKVVQFDPAQAEHVDNVKAIMFAATKVLILETFANASNLLFQDIKEAIEEIEREDASPTKAAVN